MITPEQAKRAKLYVQLNMGFQIVLIGMHLLGVLSLLSNVTKLMNEAPRMPFEDNVFVGEMIGTGLSALWIFAGFVWLPVNAWGLSKGKPWALTSTRIYWIGSLITCCCTPFGIFGLWSLSRPGVAEELGR